eukprot:COSAG02_NODE_49089_length_329_cov_0.678261_1_plen_59_part_01
MALLICLLATLALEWRHSGQHRSRDSTGDLNRRAPPARASDANRSCSVAVCTTDKFPSI